MRGDLSDTPAADVCRALAVAEATGVLDIEGPDGRGAVVWRDGHVVAASSPTPRARLGDRLVNAGLLEETGLDEVLRSQARADAHQRLGALLVERRLVGRDAVRLVVQEQVIDAVFDVLRWRYGAFRFDAGDLAQIPEVPLRIPVDQLLVETARRQQEWDELERVIPDLAAVPAFRSGVGTAAASLEPDEFTMLASIDGVRSVRELADDLGYGQFEAARIVYGLTLLDVVEILLPEDEVGRALEDALHELAAAPLDEPETEAPPEFEVAPEPEAPPEPEVASSASLESPPGLVDVARLLAELETDAGGPTPVGETVDEPDRAEPEPDPVPPPEPAPRPDGGDVSELLRELSRFALDDPGETPPPPAPRPEPPPPPAPRRTEPQREDPPKRRRRFGRG